jgi:cytochrome c-type biogenesis protein CcmE
VTRKQRRTLLIVLGLAVLSVATGLVLKALNSEIMFFLSPAEVQAKGVEPGQRFRLGGLVAKGSVVRQANATVHFVVTDGKSKMPVSFSGILPDLFREGQGVVTEGHMDPGGTFIADSVLAKHDENYMPREVAEALKKQGHWEPQTQQAKQ